jgi:undecaprenyl-diphosphatase
MGSSLLARLDARDRALFARWTIARGAVGGGRRAWVGLTHLGGVWCSVAAATLPVLAGGTIRVAALRALAGLVVSHVIVQIIKRHVLRERPAIAYEAWVSIPDAFSFPSGHATAAMAVAFAYAVAFPSLALPLMLVAAAIGFSRVVLRVHYPGDVLAGQAIAIVTDLVVFALS